MNPEYIAAGYVHTVYDKLSEYFLQPFTNIFIIIILVIMFANMYMLRKLWKIKTKDYITLMNVISLGIYFVVGVISAVLVSRLGPHGTLTSDKCDFAYMIAPRGFFIITAVVNIIEFIINIITKIKKDKEYIETIKRGYYAEESNKNSEPKPYNKSKMTNKTNFMDSISYLSESVKEKVDVESIKEKVNQVTENIKDLINNRNNKE